MRAYCLGLNRTEHLCPDACLNLIEHTAVGKRYLQCVLEFIHETPRPSGSAPQGVAVLARARLQRSRANLWSSSELEISNRPDRPLQAPAE